MSNDFQPDWTMPLSEYARVQKESMPKIKPLVWVAGRSMFDEWTAEALDGKFRVLRKHPDANVTIHMAPFTWSETTRSDFNSADEAKKACEQEYERRVLECLM